MTKYVPIFESVILKPEYLLDKDNSRVNSFVTVKNKTNQDPRLKKNKKRHSLADIYIPTV